MTRRFGFIGENYKGTGPTAAERAWKQNGLEWPVAAAGAAVVASTVEAPAVTGGAPVEAPQPPAYQAPQPEIVV